MAESAPPSSSGSLAGRPDKGKEVPPRQVTPGPSGTGGTGQGPPRGPPMMQGAGGGDPNPSGSGSDSEDEREGPSSPSPPPANKRSARKPGLAQQTFLAGTETAFEHGRKRHA